MPATRVLVPLPTTTATMRDDRGEHEPRDPG